MLFLRQVLSAALVLIGPAVPARAGPVDCEQNKVALARVVTKDARLHFVAGAGNRTPARSLPGDKESLADAAYARAAAEDVVRRRGVGSKRRARRARLRLQSRHELTVELILADENNDVISLLSEHKSEHVGNARNKILKGFAASCLVRHLILHPMQQARHACRSKCQSSWSVGGVARPVQMKRGKCSGSDRDWA